jgi:hypothetical protein
MAVSLKFQWFGVRSIYASSAEVRQHLERGAQVALETQDSREQNLLYVGWHSNRTGPVSQF